MSMLSIIKAKLGQSANTAFNFMFDASAADGTFKLTRENGQQIMTVDANGKVAFPQGQAARTDTVSMVRLVTANGYGSTNTKVRRFTNVVTNQGTDITYADSATLGVSFTINTAGIYSISYTDLFSATDYVGVSVNATQPTLGIGLLNPSEVLGMSWVGTANSAASVAWTGYIAAGSVIRPHTNAGAAAFGSGAQFTITRVA